jgi:phosphotransferase system  glucose/maltose/N-acetylglucosamine-specific IIC component
MLAIYIQIGIVLMVVAFLVFLTLDDKKNRKLREEEEREETLSLERKRQDGADKNAAND